jgi:4-hydroxythreonine-4-phosphate dehydrogenase
MHKPYVVITLGDPAGIGPEVVAGALARSEIYGCCRPVVAGHPAVLRRAVRLLGLDAGVRTIDTPQGAEPSASVYCCLPCGDDEAANVPAGRIDPRGGAAAYAAICRAADLALAGAADAMVTAPINKAALWAAGHRFPGHTELLAQRCGVQQFAMMLYLPPGEGLRSPSGLGVAHVTLHMALRDVFAHLTTGAIVEKARLCASVMRRLKRSPPQIGVCALNPHAGENGLFGDEETRLIRPAVEAAQAAGLDVHGPFPADTLMVQARDGAYDGLVAMYHDQGHIALKLLGMHRAVNITLGLTIVRTSVAHGTAFDVAWQGVAEVQSMVEAIRVAASLVRMKDRDEGLG